MRAHTRTHLLRDSMVEPTVADIGIEALHSLRILDPLWQVDNVLEVLALYLLLHREVEGTQSMAAIGLGHLDTDILVPTGPHPIQDGTQEGIPAMKK